MTLLLKTHNIHFALSDPKNKKLQVPSKQVIDETCKDCVGLWEAIDAVRVIGEASESLEAQYNIKTAIEDVYLYANHLVQDAKGMTLHTDIIFTMVNMKLQKTFTSQVCKLQIKLQKMSWR